MAACCGLLILSAPASARRHATHAERRAITRLFNDGPLYCARVRISTVNRHWGSYEFDATAYEWPGCSRVASDGVAVMHRRRGRWKLVTAGSDIACPVPGVPARVVRDLRVKCYQHDG